MQNHEVLDLSKKKRMPCCVGSSNDLVGISFGKHVIEVEISLNPKIS